jgi:DNA-binding CsgD family transcriptional regulator
MREEQAVERPAQSPDSVQAPVASGESTDGAAPDTLRPGATGRGRQPAGPAVRALPLRSPAARAASRRLARQRPQRTVLAYRTAHRSRAAGARKRASARAPLQLDGPYPVREADAAGPEAAVAEASAVAAVIEAPRRQLLLAVDALLRGRFAAAAALVDAAWEDIDRLRLPGLGSHALAVKALVHAHQGHRDALADASLRFDEWRGDREDEVTIVQGLGHAVCELLHGAGEAARARLHRPHAEDGDHAGDERSGTHHLCGPYGLTLLLECVDGSAGRDEHAAVAAHPAGRLPWNAHFVHLADAVLAGREGDPRAAETALRQAIAVAASCPPARHLGLGLVARTASRDGWGEPVRWLQEAERFYAERGIHPAARHCRGQLRDLGERVRQRRHGSAEVPERLWRLGVTVREFEVLTRLGHRRTNREIAAELHLSHRTVERHVANLLEKTRASNRRELAVLLAPEPGEPVGAHG